MMSSLPRLDPPPLPVPSTSITSPVGSCTCSRAAQMLRAPALILGCERSILLLLTADTAYCSESMRTSRKRAQFQTRVCHRAQGHHVATGKATMHSKALSFLQSMAQQFSDLQAAEDVQHPAAQWLRQPPSHLNIHTSAPAAAARLAHACESLPARGSHHIELQCGGGGGLAIHPGAGGGLRRAAGAPTHQRSWAWVWQGCKAVFESCNFLTYHCNDLMERNARRCVTKQSLRS